MAAALSAVLLGCTKNETPNADKLDYSVIDPLIADCRADLDAAVEGEDAGMYVIGSKAVFESAIAKAEGIRKTTDRQSAIDNAVETLKAARVTFNQSKVTASYPYFDGTAFGLLGNASGLLGKEYTFELWLKLDAEQGDGSIILGAEFYSDPTWDGMMLRRSETVEQALDFTVVNNTWTSTHSAEGSVPFDTWVHVACTFSGTTTAIYINGVKSGSVTIGEYEFKYPENITVGSGCSFADRFVSGYIRDIRFYNVVRSEEEIKSDMDRTLEGSENGLVAYWPLNVRSADTVVDKTGNFTATFNGIQWHDTDE